MVRQPSTLNRTGQPATGSTPEDATGAPAGPVPAQVATARQLYDSKQHTVDEIAAILACGRSTIHRALRPSA